jgi:creatinine amidohydrolase/Fe(II)-dependent formamide hydrolase-like protein
MIKIDEKIPVHNVLITRSLSLITVGTMIHTAYFYPHLAVEGHTTTGSDTLFKFLKFLGSSLYPGGGQASHILNTLGTGIFFFYIYHQSLIQSKVTLF